MDEIKADSRSGYYLIILFALFNMFLQVVSSWSFRVVLKTEPRVHRFYTCLLPRCIHCRLVQVGVFTLHITWCVYYIEHVCYRGFLPYATFGTLEKVALAKNRISKIFILCTQ